MATPVKMPKMGQTEESCILAKWHKKKGDKVKVGDVLFTLETYKATFEVESEVEGTVLETFFEEGDEVPVLTNVCVIGEEGESVDEFRPDTNEGGHQVEEHAEEQEKTSEEEMKKAADTNAFEATDSGYDTLKISPRAKNLAERAGVDYRRATPTGPHGRIIERDIEALIESGPVVTPAARHEYLKLDMDKVISGTGVGGRITTGDVQQVVQEEETLSPKVETSAAGMDYEEVSMSNIRKVIAANMLNSLATTAQLTLHTSFDATDILAFRKKIKENRDKLGLEDITLNDIILYAVSRTLLNHRELNAHLIGDKMRIFKNVHLGVAVDTERGLMVPTIFNANQKSLNEISREAKQLINDCRSGNINPDYLKGATFTVTNLGVAGIEYFTPVLNPPQTGILGVNTIVQRVKEVEGKYVYYPAMGLSLTFDHRALDGAPAARFLQELKYNLENFSILLAK